MQAVNGTQSCVLRPLAEGVDRHVVLTCGRDVWSIACYEGARFMAAMACDDKRWIYERAEEWLDSTS